MPDISKTMRIRYQPIIRLADMQPDSAEVLVRASKPDGTVLGPESIVEAMTGTDVSMALTSAIMQQAIDEYGEFDFHDLALTFAFNLPLDAMLHPDLIAIIEQIRNAAGVAADRMCFELTERHPVDDIAAAGAVISGLRRAGYTLALDDITPGMPNLDALLGLPIQAIKLDRSITTSTLPDHLAFIARIAALARARGQDMIAEGIETAATLQRIHQLGITHGQGFLFAHPLPAGELRDFLTGWAQRKPA